MNEQLTAHLIAKIVIIVALAVAAFAPPSPVFTTDYRVRLIAAALVALLLMLWFVQ